MSKDFATSYVDILKYNKNDDGTLTVYGKATSDALDIDQQICDNDWLSKAVPEWFKSGGNIREQHSAIAAGVATEYEQKGDGFYVEAKIVDPSSIKKVEHKVLKGFSIGIKGPRVIRDNKAANGRIVDGQIVELSLVDRPANPTCQLVLAKSVGGESALTQVEELIEKYSPEQERDDNGRFSGGGGGGSDTPGGADWQAPNGDHGIALGKIQDKITSTYGDAYMASRVPGQPMSADVLDMVQAKEDADNHIQEAHEKLMSGMNSQAASSLRSAARVLTDGTGSTFASHASELRALADRVKGKTKSATEEIQVANSTFIMKEEEVDDNVKGDNSDKPDDDTDGGCKCDGCKGCKAEGGCDSTPCSQCTMAKNANISKCLECGCGMVGQDHGLTTVQIPGNNSGISTTANVSTVTSIDTSGSMKSTESEEKQLVDAELPTENDILDDKATAEIVEKAVKTATESVRAEIATFKAAVKAAEEKAMALESELVTAKSAAIGGGPKRTGSIAVNQPNELMLKAAEYRAKAAATSDPILIKGYKALEKEYLSKAGKSDDQD